MRLLNFCYLSFIEIGGQMSGKNVGAAYVNLRILFLAYNPMGQLPSWALIIAPTLL